MTITLGNLTLPNYTEITATENPNASENTTLDGTLYVDFVNRRRSWRIKWNLLDIALYDQIKALYNLQFSSGTFNNLSILDRGVSNAPVYMKINDQNIEYNGGFVEGFELQLIESVAIV